MSLHIFAALKSPLFSRLLTVELKFKLKAINLQTIRHHELPDCYDFTLTVSMGWAEFGSSLEKNVLSSYMFHLLVLKHDQICRMFPLECA